MFWTLNSNSPFSASRDDTARASCGNGAKSEFYQYQFSQTVFLPCGSQGRDGRTLGGRHAFSQPDKQNHHH
jgi:hypothetical protein